MSILQYYSKTSNESLESSSDEGNFNNNIAESAELINKIKPLIQKPIVQHYQPSKKLKFNCKTEAYEYTCCLMKIIFWLAKNDIPLNKFPNVIQLEQALESQKIISTSNSITYENPISGREFLSAIALSIEKKIWQELKNTSFIGIMIDKSTDIACESHMIIHVKYCIQGVIKVKYLKLIQLQSKDADSIFNAIITLFDEKEITSKITSFTSDGASVMLRKRNGVAAKIAERNSYLFTTHCIAHRLALAFFQIHEIRWLSWYEAVKNLCLTIEPLMNTLLEMSITSNRNQKESIIQLYTQICDWKFLAVLFFLYDILGYLSNLSKIFQQRHIQISNIDLVIETTINRIKLEYLDFDDNGKLLLGENLNKFLTEIPSESNISIGTHELMWTENYESDLIAIISSFLKQLF
ncbi:5500_t:CDS:2 [Funneliformis caledonium]|uniref:5500_t:CDS:1 n=1 Tax=Funneliformis caledonium TaxID=1117310 RepID=A0A9N9C034_9GLOM|nr:5500_t:CDS:2 [Funneliformis caledonium]